MIQYMDDWYVYVPGFIIIIAGAIIFRWLIALQRKLSDHAERIAYLEAKTNGASRPNRSQT